MPLDFLKRPGRRNAAPRRPAPQPLVEEVEAQDHSLKLDYRAKSSEGVRMSGGPQALRELPNMLVGVARSDVEVVEPLAIEFQAASPSIVEPAQAMQWINANHDHSPITRHALLVLESVGAADPAFETLALALLHGEVDTSGLPDYNAIVGGVASHWDEGTGDMIVRALVAWGGKGIRGDTDRIARRLLANLLSNVLASRHAVGVAPVDRPVPAGGSGGLVCTHCGFASAHERAFYCPKCGMRLLRG